MGSEVGRVWEAVTEETPGGRGDRLFLTAEWMFLGPQVYTAQPQKAQPQAGSLGSLFSASLVWGPHLSKNSLHVLRAPARRSLCPPTPNLYMALYFPKSFHPIISSGLDRPSGQEGRILLSTLASSQLRPREVKNVPWSTQQV